MKTDGRLGLCRGVGLFFGAFMLSIFTGASALAQSGALPGPGTAVAPQSEQSIRMPLLMPDDFSVLHLVAWRVEYGTQDPENPLLEGTMPWNSGGVGIHSSVFRDPLNGKWKAYLVCTPPEETTAGWPHPWDSRNDSKRRLCVFDSADGVHWTSPQLSEVPFGDTRRPTSCSGSIRGRLRIRRS